MLEIERKKGTGKKFILVSGRQGVFCFVFFYFILWIRTVFKYQKDIIWTRLSLFMCDPGGWTKSHLYSRSYFYVKESVLY